MLVSAAGKQNREGGREGKLLVRALGIPSCEVLKASTTTYSRGNLELSVRTSHEDVVVDDLGALNNHSI